jgi:hypothetical protein
VGGDPLPKLSSSPSLVLVNTEIDRLPIHKIHVDGIVTSIYCANVLLDEKTPASADAASTRAKCASNDDMQDRRFTITSRDLHVMYSTRSKSPNGDDLHACMAAKRHGCSVHSLGVDTTMFSSAQAGFSTDGQTARLSSPCAE